MASLFQEMRARLNQTRLAPFQKKLVDSTCKTFIFPCSFLTAINNTNAGLKDANAIRDRFYQWEALLSGNESIFLNWDNSTIYTPLDSFILDGANTSHWQVTYQKGDFFKCKIIDESGDTTFGTTDFGTFGTFTSIMSDYNLKVQTTHKVDLEMLTKFYLIPRIDNRDDGYDDNSVFYISGFQNYQDSFGKFAYAEIQFSALKQELSQSGQAIQQKIYWNSPGGGYAFPKLTYSDNQTHPIDFDIHPDYAKDTGVQSIQMEVTGNAAICAIEIYGYPIETLNAPANSVFAPRKILIKDFKLPVSDDFLQVSTADNQFYYTDINLDVTTSFNDWMSRRKDIVGDKQMDFQAIVQTSGKETISTNPNVGKTINDQTLLVTDEMLKLLGTEGKFMVRPSNWFFDGYETAEDGSLIKGMGLEYIDLTQLPFKRYQDVLNLMTAATCWVNQLPYTTSYKVNWSLRDFYMIGGFLNKITFGYPFYWRQIYESSAVLFPGLEKLLMIVNKSMYDFFTSVDFASNLNPETKDDQPTTNLKKIALEVFQKAESSVLGMVFGSSATTTSLHFTLTDKAMLSRYNFTTKELIDDVTPASTVLINQQFINGDTTEYFKMSDKTYALGNTTPVGKYTDIEGTGAYVICGFGVRMLGDGDIRLTMYNTDIDTLSADDSIRDAIVYQEVMKSQAGYRNSQIREWFSFKKMNFIDAITQAGKVFHWPLPFPSPKPQHPLKPIYSLITEQENLFDEDRYGNGNQGVNIPWERKSFSIYDFSKVGLTNSTEIRNAYNTLTIPADFISTYTETNNWESSGGWHKSTINKTQSVSSNLSTFSFKNIGDTFETGVSFTISSESNDNSPWPVTPTISRTTLTATFYFVDTVLTFSLSGNNYSKFGNAPLPELRMGTRGIGNLEGGTIVSTPN